MFGVCRTQKMRKENNCTEKSKAVYTASLLILSALVLFCLCGCSSGFKKGGIVTAGPEESESETSKSLVGSWFCPDELCGYVFEETDKESGEGGCTYYKSSGPTSEKEETKGVYSIEDGKIIIVLGGERQEYDYLLDGGKLLILTDSEGNELIFTPSENR